MSFRLVSKSVTFHDPERRNCPYFALFHRLVYDIVVKKFTFTILSRDEFLVFIDENIFTVATPTNRQNDRVYAPAAMKKERRYAERVISTGLYMVFGQSLTLSVALSKTPV